MLNQVAMNRRQLCKIVRGTLSGCTLLALSLSNTVAISTRTQAQVAHTACPSRQDIISFTSIDDFATTTLKEWLTEGCPRVDAKSSELHYFWTHQCLADSTFLDLMLKRGQSPEHLVETSPYLYRSSWLCQRMQVLPTQQGGK